MSEVQMQDNRDSATDESEVKYTIGEELTFIRVRFPGNAKSFSFLKGKRNFNYGQKVIAMSDRGMDVGYINSFPYTVKFNKAMLPIRTINKLATDDEIDKKKENFQKEREAEEYCNERIKLHELDMNVTHVEFIQFGKKAVFYFTAPARVDFRALVKDLVGKLKMRIELRQISIRDRASALGGLGPCGKELCCSSFLSEYGHASVKMAKNQNLGINFSKLNGMCGQLKCCLSFEDQVYFEKKKRLPKEDSMIKTQNGDCGKVLKLHILSEQFDMLTDRGQIRRYAQTEFSPGNKPPKDWKFPKKFEHITNETHTVVGLDDAQARKTRQFEEDIAHIKSEVPQKALNILNDLFEDPEREKEVVSDA